MENITKSDFYVIRMENPKRKDRNVLIVADKVSSSTHIVVTPKKMHLRSAIIIFTVNPEERQILFNLRQCPRMENYTRYELTDVLNADFSKGEKMRVYMKEVKQFTVKFV